MRTLLPLLLWLTGCGTVETAPTPVPAINASIASIVDAAVQRFADAGHAVTVDYPVMVVTDIPARPQTIATCTIYPDNTRVIQVRAWYVATQSREWLVKLMCHEIAHCSYSYEGHVDQGTKQVMSAYQNAWDDTLAPDAWNNFWLLITQLEQKTSWFGL